MVTSTRPVDFAPLERLLHLAGSTDAPALMLALLDDLKSTQSSLDQAWKRPDFAALRANSHVLIGLAGTIGDTELHALAQQLNRGANTQNKTEMVDFKEPIMSSLASLIAQLLNRVRA